MLTHLHRLSRRFDSASVSMWSGPTIKAYCIRNPCVESVSTSHLWNEWDCMLAEPQHSMSGSQNNGHNRFTSDRREPCGPTPAGHLSIGAKVSNDQSLKVIWPFTLIVPAPVDMSSPPVKLPPPAAFLYWPVPPVIWNVALLNTNFAPSPVGTN